MAPRRARSGSQPDARSQPGQGARTVKYQARGTSLPAPRGVQGTPKCSSAFKRFLDSDGWPSRAGEAIPISGMGSSARAEKYAPVLCTRHRLCLQSRPAASRAVFPRPAMQIRHTPSSDRLAETKDALGVREPRVPRQGRGGEEKRLSTTGRKAPRAGVTRALARSLDTGDRPAGSGSASSARLKSQKRAAAGRGQETPFSTRAP